MFYHPTDEFSVENFIENTGFQGRIEVMYGACKSLRLEGFFNCTKLFNSADRCFLHSVDKVFYTDQITGSQRKLGEHLDLHLDGDFFQTTLNASLEANFGHGIEAYTDDEVRVMEMAWHLIEYMAENLFWGKVIANLQEAVANTRVDLPTWVHEHPELQVSMDLLNPEMLYSEVIYLNTEHQYCEVNESDIIAGHTLLAEMIVTISDRRGGVTEWFSRGCVAFKAEQHEQVMRNIFEPLIGHALSNYHSQAKAA